MSFSTLSPVSVRERIQTIDIIRGFALLGILIINFTVDTANDSPYEGWTGFGDQSIYWVIRLFMDDRFQTIYCFLFGLGFALIMQRAAERNSSFVFIFLRRMIALIVIASVLEIFTGSAFTTIGYYAIMGILLLLFTKVPTKFLPALAILLFVFPRIINAVERMNGEVKHKAMVQKNVIVDTATLTKYTGVYETPLHQKVIFFRKGDSLISEGPTSHFSLIAQSDSQFLRKEYNMLYTFLKDSTGTVSKISVTYPDFPEYSAILLIRTQDDLQKTLALQRQEKADTTKSSGKKVSYKEFVARNEYVFRYNYILNFQWKKFLWKGNYEVAYILALFLIGLYTGRRRIFYDIPANAGLLRNVLNWGLVIGCPLVAFNVGLEMWNSFHGIKYWDHYSALANELIDLEWNIGIICVAMAYIAGITLLLENFSWKRKLSFFATIGRMGLTNYALHLFARTLIFEKVYGFLALEGKVGCLYRLPIAIVVFILLYLFSYVWFKYFKMGPLEWLWRSATYWKLQPIRRRELRETADVALQRI